MYAFYVFSILFVGKMLMDFLHSQWRRTLLLATTASLHVRWTSVQWKSRFITEIIIMLLSIGC